MFLINTKSIGRSGAAVPYTAHFLVQAGGGAGGIAGISAGAGAGGLRTSYSTSGRGSSAESQATLESGAVYTVTVGAGGAAHNSSYNNGVASSLVGTGVSISSVGGGYGTINPATPRPDGGCGGSGPTGGLGTAAQGYDGASDNQWAYGGGGGTAANGSAAPWPSGGGHGGAGTQVNIDGNNYYWGGGGGGGGHAHPYTHPSIPGYGGAAGNGGQGGGGAGSVYSGNSGAGSAPAGPEINAGGAGESNLNHIGGAGGVNSGGGGGGGADSSPTGSPGGSGIVILRMPDSSYSGTKTGTSSVATNVGGTGETVVTWTGTGSYTA